MTSYAILIAIMLVQYKALCDGVAARIWVTEPPDVVAASSEMFVDAAESCTTVERFTESAAVARVIPLAALP
jgi:hypothetical protein